MSCSSVPKDRSLKSGDLAGHSIRPLPPIHRPRNLLSKHSLIGATWCGGVPFCWKWRRSILWCWSSIICIMKGSSGSSTMFKKTSPVKFPEINSDRLIRLPNMPDHNFLRVLGGRVWPSRNNCDWLPTIANKWEKLGA